MKRNVGLSQSVDDAKKSAVCIEEGTYPGQSYDKLSGHLTVKKKFACQLSKKEKGKATGKPQGKTAEEDFPDHFPKLFYASASLDFSNCGKEHGGDGIGDG